MAVFQRDVQPGTEPGSKPVLSVVQLFGIIPLKSYPKVPSGIDAKEILEKVPRRPMSARPARRIADAGRYGQRERVPALEGFVDFAVQIGMLNLCEIGLLHADVVDDFGVCGALGEEHGSTAAERLGVELMGRYQDRVFCVLLIYVQGIWHKKI